MHLYNDCVVYSKVESAPQARKIFELLSYPLELDSGISRLISTDTTSFHNMDKYMKGQKSPLVVLYRSKTLLNSRLGSWHKALPGANSLALTSRTPELSYNCNAKLIMVKKSLWPRVQRYFPKALAFKASKD